MKRLQSAVADGMKCAQARPCDLRLVTSLVTCSLPGLSKLASLAAVSVVLMGCAGGAVKHATEIGCCATPPPATAPAAGPVYDLAGIWTTDAGKKIPLRDLSGRPRVVAMFYTSCEMICPMTLEVLQGIESRLAPDMREKVGFVLLTLDPHTDTPRALSRYRRDHRLPESRWTLLHGSPESVARVASAMGVTYGRDSFGRLSHSAQISLLDGSGRVVLQQSKLTGDFNPMIAYLRRPSDVLPSP